MIFKKILIFIALFAALITRASSLDNNSSYIVKFKSGYDTQKAETTLGKRNADFKRIFQVNRQFDRKNEVKLSAAQKDALKELSNYFLISGSESGATSEILSELESNPNVEFIEPNYIYSVESPPNSGKPNDPLYPDQWALKAICAEKAWEKASGKDVLIGVIDTGIDYLHPDLINSLRVNSAEDLNGNGVFDPWSANDTVNGVTGDLNGLDDDGNGYADDVIGYDFVDQTIMNIGDARQHDPNPNDEEGHGTFVSGVITAERDNNKGVVGLAYDSKIITARAFDATGNAESDDIAKAIVYCVTEGVKILNFSFGEPYSSTIIHDAVKFANLSGVFMSSSAGNNNWALPHYPSDYKEVVSVGASVESGERDSRSNYGMRLNLISPGSSIYSTEPYDDYSKSSGTSFSAPYVAATAALLLELNSNYSPEELLGVIESSATDAGAEGWDIYTGAGVLNAGKAVNTVGSAIVSIHYPQNEDYFDKDETQELPIVITSFARLFESYNIYYGLGYSPKDWIPISNGETRVKRDTSALLDLSGVPDTNIVVRLVVNLTNAKTIERRISLNVSSSESNLKFASLKTRNPLFKNKRRTAVFAVTNQKSKFFIEYREQNADVEYRRISDYRRQDYYHALLIDEDLSAYDSVEARALAVRSDGDTAVYNFTFKPDNITIPEKTFVQKEYGAPALHLEETVTDLYNDNKPAIVGNDISAGTWGGVKTYVFENGQFKQRDSLNNTWIPRGVGDSNDDGLKEIFAAVSYQSALFQAADANSSVFSEVLFADSLSRLWAADMTDIDGDGIDELLVHDDTSYKAFKYSNGKYRIIAEANPHVIIGTYPGLATGDFDSDGNYEICFGERGGRYFIYEYNSSDFILEYSYPYVNSSSEQYMASPDIDGDGEPEILIMNFGASNIFGKEDAGEKIWTYKIIKSDGANNYKTLWEDQIYGVRGGFDYKNGVSAGNLDGVAGDEIILSAFPNLYILSWDAAAEKFVPIWTYPYAYANSAVVYDFDGNGKNEIGFTTFSRTSFFEIADSSAPKAPLSLRGYAVNDKTARLEWEASDDAETYEILRMIRKEQGYYGYTAAITTETFVLIDTLKPEHNYEFVVRATNESFPNKYSEISNFVDIFTHNPIRPLSLDAINQNTLLVYYENHLPEQIIEPKKFEVMTQANEFLAYPSTATPVGDTTIILHFDEKIPDGELILNALSFRDRHNTPTIAKELQFTMHKDSAEKELFLKRIEVNSSVEALLYYSEPVESASALNESNYELSPYGGVVNVRNNPENDFSVFLEFDKSKPALAAGKEYVVSVKNVTNASGANMTTGPGSSIGFTLYADDGKDAYAYPNPIKTSESDIAYFANLPPKAEVVIYSTEGDELCRLREKDGDGGVEWNLKDKNGDALGSGVYLFKVVKINADGSKTSYELKKFMILR